MTDQAGFERFLSALQKLPTDPGVVFHGGLEVDLVTGAVETGVLACSTDLRVATENFTTPLVYAIVTRTGRQIGALSAHPFEREVVLLPGSLLSPIGRFHSESPAADVIVLEELAVGEAAGVPLPDGIPSTVEGIAELVTRRLAAAAQAPAVEVASPGKFTSRISLR